jgi:histidine ammonia-lyase
MLYLFVFLCLAVERAISLARQADIIAALSTEALRGSVRHLHPREFLPSYFFF